jgi:hypothetical protein
MSLHSGSSALAHNLDRFDIHADFELAAAEAARLHVEPETVRLYRSWYGDELVIVKSKGLVSRMPVYEAQIRLWMLGERICLIQQVADAAA